MANNENDKQQDKGNPNKLTKTHAILIFGFAVVLVAIAIAGYFIYKALNKEPEIITDSKGTSYVVDENNLNDIGAIVDEQVTDGMFEVTMNTIWTFESGDKASSDAYVANANSNHKPVFIEVTLADTEELVYTSTVIPVGSVLKTIKLDKSIPKGTYNAVCTYSLLGANNDIDSTFAVNITLEVIN